jgi:hypothetical protein
VLFLSQQQIPQNQTKVRAVQPSDRVRICGTKVIVFHTSGIFLYFQKATEALLFIKMKKLQIQKTNPGTPDKNKTMSVTMATSGGTEIFVSPPATMITQANSNKAEPTRGHQKTQKKPTTWTDKRKDCCLTV